MLTESGCDLEKTYFDVPRMRTAFPGDYLKSGIAYAFHPHRDTWYSAPFCQINWWMPHLRAEFRELHGDPSALLRAEPIKNGSSEYNYHKWNLESRHNAAQHVKTDTRVQPRPKNRSNWIRRFAWSAEVGGAISSRRRNLHSTVPNTSDVTRYSIDFRTVHLDDVMGRIGARQRRLRLHRHDDGRLPARNRFLAPPEEAMAMYLDGRSPSTQLSMFAIEPDQRG